MPADTGKFIAGAVRVLEAYQKEHAGEFESRSINSVVVAQLLEDFYNSFDCPVNPPLVVRRAMVLKFLDNLTNAEFYLRTLGYNGGLKIYYFTYANMFHGVEPDGHIHT